MKSIALTLLMLLAPLATSSQPGTVGTYIEKLKMAKPIKYKNLMIFPLTIRTMGSTDYVTLDKAMESNWLEIREIGSGEVNSVELKNTGKEIVFIMTGEMLSGAKQDRMLREDVLVPPNSDWLRVPVYCVEHGRWVSVSSGFESAQEVAPNELRQRARITEDQSEVWDAIASSQAKLGIDSRTSTVQANYEDERIRKELAEYTQHLGKIPQLAKNTVGVVVAAGDRVICVDIFANNGLLREFWSKLLRSYVMDAILESEAIVMKKEIEELLHDLSRAKYVSLGTPGMGDLFNIETHYGRGNALVSKGTVIHMDFFVDEMQDDNDAELRLDIRREQRLND